MESLNKLLVTASILFVIASSESGAQECSTSTTINAHCSNGSLCSTWYICNEQKQCECGDYHNYAVICENNRSAVLDCHCVTFNLMLQPNPLLLDHASTTV